MSIEAKRVKSTLRRSTSRTACIPPGLLYVAVAALKPHFAARLCAAAEVKADGVKALLAIATHQAIAAFMPTQTRQQLDKLAVAKDILLHTLAK